jgi:S-formylglutathione hydrolase FrmB
VVGATAIGRSSYHRAVDGYSDTRGAKVVRYELKSALLGKTLDEIAVVPSGGGRRPLLVLLHGRSNNDNGPAKLLSDELFAALDGLGQRAPVVVLLNGGTASYYHDRREGQWGSMMLREAIPNAVKRFKTTKGKVAIGGISMGGFGSFYLAGSKPSTFCAVGGHSAALWRSGGDTPEGAFDDAEDYARTDVWALARAGRYKRLPVWIDVGDSDGFRDTDVAFAKFLKARGTSVQLHVGSGGHDSNYWHEHMAEYLRFYANALSRCKTVSPGG